MTGIDTLRLAIVAGEASGDLLGAGLIRAIRARGVAVEAEGIGGPEMLACGCRSLFPIETLSVMGLVEVLGRYPAISQIRARLARRWLEHRPHLFVGIDAPDFNLALEARLRRGGVRTVQYVSPQVWAWRRYRVRKIARAVDCVLALFPFEADFYRNHGVPVEYVGHPLADAIPRQPDRAAARRALALDPQAEIVALLPGSRTSEVRYIAAPMVRTARWLLGRRPKLRFLMPAAGPVVRAACREIIDREGVDLPIRLLDGQARAAMTAADAVLTASGTASLEAALLKRPMVVTYRMHPITFRVMRAMFCVDMIALPNLLAGRRLVAELIQSDCDPMRLGPAMLALLESPAQREWLVSEFTRIHDRLSRDASARAADAVLRLLECKGAGHSGRKPGRPAVCPPSETPDTPTQSP